MQSISRVSEARYDDEATQDEDQEFDDPPEPHRAASARNADLMSDMMKVSSPGAGATRPIGLLMIWL